MERPYVRPVPSDHPPECISQSESSDELYLTPKEGTLHTIETQPHGSLYLEVRHLPSSLSPVVLERVEVPSCLGLLDIYVGLPESVYQRPGADPDSDVQGFP